METLATLIVGVLICCAPVWLILKLANSKPSKVQTKKVISLNDICDEMDAMCGAPRNRTVLSTKITIE